MSAFPIPMHKVNVGDQELKAYMRANPRSGGGNLAIQYANRAYVDLIWQQDKTFDVWLDGKKADGLGLAARGLSFEQLKKDALDILKNPSFQKSTIDVFVPLPGIDVDRKFYNGFKDALEKWNPGPGPRGDVKHAQPSSVV